MHGKAPQGRIRCGANQLTNLKTTFIYCTLLLRVLTVLDEDLLFPSFPLLAWVAFRVVVLLLPVSDRLVTGALRLTDLISEDLFTSELLATGVLRFTVLESEDLFTSERVATDRDEDLLSFLYSADLEFDLFVFAGEVLLTRPSVLPRERSLERTSGAFRLDLRLSVLEFVLATGVDLLERTALPLSLYRPSFRVYPLSLRPLLSRATTRLSLRYNLSLSGLWL